MLFLSTSNKIKLLKMAWGLAINEETYLNDKEGTIKEKYKWLLGFFKTL
jgi:hypothetical protein